VATPPEASPAPSVREAAPVSATPVERIGVLGGMFNPPHLGHLALARTAARDLDLGRVMLTPALVPPHKPAKWDPGAEQRLLMCRLLARGDPRVGVCTLELERPPPSYTVDTLRSIHASHPDAELTLILGADIARTLGSWRESREILRLARIAVAERDGVTREEVLDALAPLDVADRTVFLDMAPHDISSSRVRRALNAGESIDALVGSDIAAHIAQHELYGRLPAPRAQGVVER
jgi:nicotinate-nucleotide adenylyltransferase